MFFERGMFSISSLYSAPVSSTMSYLSRAFIPVPQPQTQRVPIRGREEEMVVNNTGGYVFKASDRDRLERFLVLGTEGGTYYATEKKLTLESAKHVSEMIASGQGKIVVDTVVDMANKGRAPRQNPSIFVLAMVARQAPDRETRAYAYQAVHKVCKIPTALFGFIEYQKVLGPNSKPSWGVGMRKAVETWYTQRPVTQLAYQTTKYRSRMSWNHRDVIRLAHIKPEEGSKDRAEPATTPRDLVMHYLVQGDTLCATDIETSDTKQFLDAVEFCTKAGPEDENIVEQLILKHRLAWEHLPSSLHRSPKIWRALLDADMPLMAMIRNLGRMSSIGLLTPLSEEVDMVCKALRDPKRIAASKVHPFAIMLALKTYEEGEGNKGKLKWQPDQRILDALGDAYYLAFNNVEPTGKRYMIGIDVSGSMCAELNGSAVTAQDAACAVASALVRVEDKVHTMAFQGAFVPFPIGKSEKLSSVVARSQGLPFGSTDCSLPIEYARQHKIPVDVFVVLTDNETWCGKVHPTQALQQYRKEMNLPRAKLAVLAFSATQFTIADPKDVDMMDMAGLDASIPVILADFATH